MGLKKLLGISSKGDSQMAPGELGRKIMNNEDTAREFIEGWIGGQDEKKVYLNNSNNSKDKDLNGYYEITVGGKEYLVRALG